MAERLMAERLMALYAAGHTKTSLQDAGVASVWTQNNILNGGSCSRAVAERILSFREGAPHPCQRLYVRPIRNMLNRWCSNGMTVGDIADITGVSPWTIRRIRNGRQQLAYRSTVRAILRHKTEIDERVIFG